MGGLRLRKAMRLSRSDWTSQSKKVPSALSMLGRLQMLSCGSTVEPPLTFIFTNRKNNYQAKGKRKKPQQYVCKISSPKSFRGKRAVIFVLILSDLTG